MLSDIDVAHLEAELETDLATRVNQQEDASDAQPSLELDSLRESISNKDDDDDQLKSFSLLANARESICLIRQDATRLAQRINDELLESRNDATHNQVTISEVDDKDEVQWPTEEDTIFSLTQIPPFTTNDDVVDHSDSDSSTNCERDCEKDDCDADAATNNCCETYAAKHHEYIDQTSLVADESFEQAMIEANDQLRMIEEKHRMKRLILEQRKEHIRRNRNAKILQRFWQRIITRKKLLLTSIISNLTSNTVQSAVEVGLSQCTTALESTIDCSIIVIRSSRDLSIPQTRQMMNWNDLNCRHIMVIRDPTNYKARVIILYQRHFMLYVVDLRRRLTDEVANHSSDILLLRYSDDSETRFSQFTKQALVVHVGRIQQSLLTNLSSPLMLEDNPLLDLTDKSSLCLILCQMTQRVMTRRALHALQCLKAAVQIQSIYRGFIVRRRLDSVQCTAFDYIDSEIDDILGDNSNDMLQFDEEDEGEDSWNPCRPYIESTVHCSIVENNICEIDTTTIPKPESEPLHRVLSSSRTHNDNESEDTISRTKANPKIVRRSHLKEKKQEEPIRSLTWQSMKVKDIRVAQVSKSNVCVYCSYDMLKTKFDGFVCGLLLHNQYRP